MKRSVLIALIFLVVFTGASWLLLNGIRSQNQKYVTAPVERGSLESQVAATGTVNPVTSVQVGAQVTGKIKQLYADFNSRVKKGNLLAEIDPSVFEAQVQQAEGSVENARALLANGKIGVADARVGVLSAEASLKRSLYDAEAAKANWEKARVGVVDARRTLARQEELLKRNLIAESDRDLAQTSYDSQVALEKESHAQYLASISQKEVARAQHRSALNKEAQAANQLKAYEAQAQQSEASLSLAKSNLQYTKITSPVDGIVIARNVDVGQTVTASLQAPVLFLLAQDLSQMEVDAAVDEADVGEVREGQAATFTIDAVPGKVFRGIVSQIRNNPVTVQNVVTYTTVIRISNPSEIMKPGMTAYVSIVTRRKENVLKVPNAALRFSPPEEMEKPGRQGNREGQRAARYGQGGGKRGEAPGPGEETGRVWVVSGRGKVREVQIETGISDGSFTEVRKGDLSEGERVAVAEIQKKRGSRGKSSPLAPTRMYR